MSFFTDTLLNFLCGIIGILLLPLKLLPDISLSSDFYSAVETANTFLITIDYFFPVDTFISILLLIVGFEFLYFGYKGIMWIIRKIPMIS